MKKYLTIIPILVFGFLLTENALATTIYSFTTDTATIGSISGEEGSGFIQEFYPQTGDALTVTVKINDANGCSGFVELFDTYDGNYIDTHGGSGGSHSMAISDTQAFTDGLNTFSLTGDTAVTFGLYYGIQIQSTNRACYFEMLGSNSTKNGNDESTQLYNSIPTWTSQGATRHMYLTVTDVPYTAPWEDTIAFNAPPTPNASSFPFSSWSVDYTSINAGNSIKINVCPTSTSCPRYDTLNASLIATGNAITKTIPFSAPLNSGVSYTAIAYLYNGTTTLATSTVSFDLSFTSAYGTGTSTNMFASSTLNCEQYPFVHEYSAFNVPFFATTTPNRIGCEIKSLTGSILTFMFVPGQIADSVGILQNNIQSFKNVIPFSIYFSVTSSTIEGLSATSTGNSISVDLPSLSGATVTTVPIITSTTLTDAFTTTHCNSTCASAIKTRIFNWIKVLIWGSAGIAAITLII